MDKKITTLANGLRIVTDKTENSRICSALICVGSGSSFETPETAGISHFIEHIVFKGSKKRSALDIAVGIDEIGGFINAYTSREYTCFYVKMLSEHAEKAVDILCDMVRNPRLDEKDIELEKGVIKEEISMCKDNAEDLSLDSFYASVWKNSMLGSDVLGSVKTVDAVTRESLQAHIGKFYVPERTVISISGSFNEEALMKICEEYFGSMENTGFEFRATDAEFMPDTVTVKKDFMQNQLVLGFPGIAATDNDLEAAWLIALMLGSSSSSRLFQQIRENLGLAYSIEADNADFINTGAFLITMALGEESEERAVREAVRIISEFSSTVTERELARVKEQIVTSIVMDFESVSYHASRNGRFLLLFNKIVPDEQVIAKIRAVTLDDIRRVAERIFDFSKISLCVVGKVKSKKTYRKIIGM